MKNLISQRTIRLCEKAKTISQVECFTDAKDVIKSLEGKEQLSLKEKQMIKNIKFPIKKDSKTKEINI